MNGEGVFFRWASRILAVVCLVLLVLNLLKRFDEQPSPQISEPAVAQSESVTAPAEPVRAIIPQDKRAAAQGRPYKSVAGKHRVKRADTRVRPYNAPPASPPEPAVTTLKPLGYVERADGTVQAVVADGPFVAVLREGELFQDEYRVAKVSTTLVEIEKQPAAVAVEAPDLAPPPGPEREVAAIQEAASEPVSPVALQVPDEREAQSSLQTSPTVVASVSTSIENKGEPPPEPENPQTLAESREDSRGPSPAKPAGSTPVPAQVPPKPTRTLKPLGYAEWAGGRLQAVVETEGEVYLVSEGEVFADKSRALSVTKSSVEVVEGFSPPARASPVELAAFEAGEQSATQPLTEVAHSPPKPAEKVGRASRKAANPAVAVAIRGRSVPEIAPDASLPTLGYVEDQNGEVQAILADGDGVCLVRRGDVVGGKDLALSISRRSVEVSAIASAGQEVSAGVAAKNRGTAAYEVLAKASQPPPMGTVQEFARREEVKTEAAEPAVSGLEPQGSEGLAAAAGTALGYVEMADGRVQTIVSDGDGVVLVHDGFERGEAREAASQPLVAASHSPPGDGPGAASGEEEGEDRPGMAPGPAYLVTHVHSPRFDFDLHVRLPDNRSD